MTELIINLQNNSFN